MARRPVPRQLHGQTEIDDDARAVGFGQDVPAVQVSVRHRRLVQVFSKKKKQNDKSSQTSFFLFKSPPPVAVPGAVQQVVQPGSCRFVQLACGFLPSLQLPVLITPESIQRFYPNHINSFDLDVTLVQFDVYLL